MSECLIFISDKCDFCFFACIYVVQLLEFCAYIINNTRIIKRKIVNHENANLKISLLAQVHPNQKLFKSSLPVCLLIYFIIVNDYSLYKYVLCFYIGAWPPSSHQCHTVLWIWLWYSWEMVSWRRKWCSGEQQAVPRSSEFCEVGVDW